MTRPVGRPLGVKDRVTRKEMEGRSYNKDGNHYVHSDSGCPNATEYLKRQSRCLQCPFTRCIYG